MRKVSTSATTTSSGSSFQNVGRLRRPVFGARPAGASVRNSAAGRSSGDEPARRRWRWRPGFSGGATASSSDAISASGSGSST